MRSKPIDMTIMSENMTLKNELLHSQKLITENQQIAEAQNQIIHQLRACLMQAEER
jgi:hypothetical protein